MDKLFIQLSRTGDVCNALQICHAEHKEGKRVGLMVCSEFASILEGVSYVEPIVFDGRPWELVKAYDQAKKLCPKVICLQVNGPMEEVLKCTYEPAGQKNAITDSFAREAWKLAGRLIEWGKHPLVFNKRNPEREKSHMPKGHFSPGKKKKILLISAHSTSSPFPYKDLLVELLALKFPNMVIVDLANVLAERFYDLLGLYEAAYCLVTVDTAHLHLAAAVPSLPVMALVQDAPLYWHGSAWRPQHHFHCRYGDFTKRAVELLVAIENISMVGIRPIIHAYPGEVRRQNGYYTFAIQPGSCHRDSVNALVPPDKERHPMLRSALRMVLQTTNNGQLVLLTRRDTRINDGLTASSSLSCYAYRMSRKDGRDTFVPIVDLLCAPAAFWERIFPSIPDLVMGDDGFWSRVLVELFKMNGAKEVEGIYQNE